MRKSKVKRNVKSTLKIREDWLHKAIKHFTGSFKRHGYKMPQVKVSVGFPGGGSARKRIGEHWAPAASDDKVGSIFISPIIDDGVEVLGTLVHEMVHAAVGNKEGHGPVFKKCATAIGLEGKMRSTTSGPALVKEIKKLIKKIGKYPHAKINLSMSPIKKQKARMIKMECADCGYIARTSQSNIDLMGPVKCPCNGEPMEAK